MGYFACDQSQQSRVALAVLWSVFVTFVVVLVCFSSRLIKQTVKMANDREVLREIWEGRLPVCFVLDSDETHGLQAPEPYFLMVPRLSYFPLVTDKVRKHLIRYIHSEKQESEMWLDYNKQPLKWHYPIGVLFDLYASDVVLPWTITVHFDKFPESVLIHCSCREVVESHFISSVKEADVLKHKSSILSTMQKKDHTQLWLGLQNDKFDQFWEVNRRLMEVGSEETFKSIPFRCYRGDELKQIIIKPMTDDGQWKTLHHLLKEVYASDADKLRVVTHGVEVPQDTPLQWMSEHMSYPDNFLHLCIQ